MTFFNDFLNVLMSNSKKIQKRLSILLCFVMLLLFAFDKNQVIYKASIINEEEDKTKQNEISMYSGSYALLDGDTRRVLKGKEQNSPMANASTTKIMTCIIALETCKLDEVVTISENAASQPKVRLGVKEGEQYPLEDMLYGLMLESYNDCAVAIAEHVAGSVDEFAKKMNKKAEEIGCKDTYFITPNGLDSEDETSFHHTTAEDLCKMMAYCVWSSPQKEEFLKITQMRNYSGASNDKQYIFTNHNTFLNQMDGVLRGKTGFTNKAGYCYVAAMEKNGEKYCIALLACGWPNNKNYKWKDARTLLEYGIQNYKQKNVIVKEYIKEYKVDGFVGNREFDKINQQDILEIYTLEKNYQMLLKDTDQIETEIIIYSDTKAPIKNGQVMGKCNLYLGEILFDSISIYSKENVNIWGIKDIIYTIFYQFLTFSL